MHQQRKAVRKSPAARVRPRPEPSQAADVALRAGSICARVLIPVVLLAILGAAAVYVRLLNGPISLKMLVEPVARSLSADLALYDVAIEDAILRMTPTGGLEFRLRNVRLLDSNRQPVAVAPLAAVSLSHAALWQGRIAPERIVLIEPRLLVLLGDAPGTVSDVRQSQARSPGAAGLSVALQDRAANTAGGDNLSRIDLARVLVESVAQARNSGDSSLRLKQIGLKQGTLILDYAGRPTVWRVIDGEIDVEHKKRRSAISARLSIGSAQGPWELRLQAQESEKEQSLAVTLEVSDLVPASLVGSIADTSPIRSIDAPIQGKIVAGLSSDGTLLSTSGNFAIGTHADGTRPPPGAASRLPFDTAEIAFTLDPRTGAIDLGRSVVENAGSRIAFAGRMTPPQGDGRLWSVDLRGLDGRLATSDAGGEALSVDQFSAEATIDQISGDVALKQAMLRAGGTEVRARGRPQTGTPRTGPSLEVEFSPMTLGTAKALWPRSVAPVAREWVMSHVSRGQISAGTLVMDEATAGNGAAKRLSLAVEASDVVLSPVTTLPPIEAPRALIRLEGRSIEIAVPEATTGVSAQRRVALRAGRFAIPDVDTENPVGELSFRLQGGLSHTMAILEREPIALGRLLGGSLDTAEGRIEGQLKLVIPLERDVRFRDMKLDGKARITEGRAKGLAGGYDVQGAVVNIDIGSEAVEAKGDMLVGGVNTRLALQHIFNASADKQPPLRLSANLDAADRANLGLDLEQFLTGDVPVDVTLTKGPQGETIPKVRADLTNAELAIEALTWSKPAGRTAIAQFELGRGTKYKSELQNFKLQGDDVAIEGWLGVDQSNRLREFYFPDFTLNLVSRLELQGLLRADNIWDVRVKGTTFDGRDFFRSLFSVGRLGQRTPPVRPGREAAGTDIRVELDTVLGFSDLALKGLRLQAARRGDKLTALTARGIVEGGKPLDVVLAQSPGEPRRLTATSEDAGQVFRLVGFYPSMQGGRMRLTVNLDGRGPAEKTGLLEVGSFRLLGDPVISEVLQVNDEAGTASGKGRPRMVRQAIDFDSFVAPFAVGYGQFVLEGADLRGPLFGANLRGKADFASQTVSLAGTYTPLQGLNAAVGVIPGLGQILTGPRGEGVLGITFAVQGPMARPQVLVNPLSLLTPGFLREITQLSNPSTQVTPTIDRPPSRQSSQPARASSAPAAERKRQAPGVQPELGGGWTSDTVAPAKRN